MPILICGDRGTPIMTTKEEIKQSAIKGGSRNDLLQSLASDDGPTRVTTRVAFFETKSTRDVYYSRDETASPYSPIVKLFLSGVQIKDIWRIYRNYFETNADMGTSVLCGGYGAGVDYPIDDPERPEDPGVLERKQFQERARALQADSRDDGVSSNKHLRELINDRLRYGRYNLVSTSGLKDLMRRDFPLYVAPGPNVDITLETPSTAGTHDGFHTVHRLYMATAFRILRNKQNPGGREGVAALLVDKFGRILAWALKNPAHPALHAESSSILAYGERLPAGVRIYSTLKPCAMCAGWITTLSGGGHFVYYGQNDTTSAAAKTFLDEEGGSKLLDGRRRVLGVRGIVPIYAGGGKANVTLAEMLDTANTGSPIDFATSDKARTIYGHSDRMLERKIQKYRDNTATGRNHNVWAALSYLTGFLNSIGVGTENVAQPPVPAAPMDTHEG
jgi:tRNA(Arg) A34 adenosine deaminase TadA